MSIEQMPEGYYIKPSGHIVYLDRTTVPDMLLMWGGLEQPEVLTDRLPCNMCGPINLAMINARWNTKGQMTCAFQSKVGVYYSEQ